jgi:excisionase family DNA binding protein
MKFSDGEVTELFKRAEELGLLPEHVQPEADPWLTANEAAAYSGYSVGELRNMLSDGRLQRRYSKGNSIRVRRSDLDQLIEQGGSKAA